MAKKKGNYPLFYMCYPFDREDFRNYNKIQNSLAAMHIAKTIPVMCTAYLMDAQLPESYKKHMLRRTIEACDGLCVFYEKYITERMLFEIHHAKIIGLKCILIEFEEDKEVKDG